MLPKSTRIGLLAPITWGIPPKGYGPWEQDVADIVTGLQNVGYQNIVLYATKEARIPGVKTVAIVDRPLGENPVKGAGAYELLHIAHAMERAGEEVDILNNHLNFMPLLFSSKLNIPVVTTLHGAATEENGQVAFRHYRDLPYISISDAERAILPELNYVQTVYNPIDFDFYSPSNEPIQPYLINVGRMDPRKGIHNAVVLAKQVGMPLYLAGPVEPVCQEYFDQQILPHVDGRNVTYLGNLSGEEVKQWVERATAFVGLTEWPEPFGRAIAESMACGTPVIGSALGAHNELIIDGVSGLLVHNVEEAARRFPEIAGINRMQCRATVAAMYSVPASTKSLLTAYEATLEWWRATKG